MPPSPQTALEMLLYGLGPAWHLVADRLDGLADACRERLLGDEGEDFEDRRAFDHAAWILDRLLPLDGVEPFRAARNRGRWGYAAYAWGRRAPEEMLEVPAEEFRCWPMQAAWVETRESDDELLHWQAVMRERGWSTDQDWTLPIREYVERSPDAKRVMASLEHASGGAALVMLVYLLAAVGGEILRASEPPEDIEAALEQAGHVELAEALERHIVPRMRPWVAKRAWVSHQTDLDTLVRAEWEVAYEPTRRLAAITPKDRFDVWDDILRRPERGNFPIRAFCEWLDPQYRDVLIREFDREDLEWAACAFHAFLHMAPPPVIEGLAVSDRRPAWQRDALDRFLHAPSSLRPPPYVTDVQETEMDCRLYDPFNVRSF